MADIAGVRGVCLVGDIFYALRQIQNAVGLLVQSCLGNPDHDWICSPDSVGCDQFYRYKRARLVHAGSGLAGGLRGDCWKKTCAKIG